MGTCTLRGLKWLIKLNGGMTMLRLRFYFLGTCTLRGLKWLIKLNGGTTMLRLRFYFLGTCTLRGLKWLTKLNEGMTMLRLRFYLGTCTLRGLKMADYILVSSNIMCSHLCNSHTNINSPKSTSIISQKNKPCSQETRNLTINEY